MTGNGDNLQVRSGFLPDRIVHLHPTRLCNLACLHCYSESGPKEKTSLSLEELQPALLVLRPNGVARTHNYLRGREDAFDRSCAALARFAESDHPISAAISLTREAIPELPEL